MRPVLVADMIATTALGDLDATFNGLMAGSCGLTAGGLSGALAKWPVGAVADLHAELGSAARMRALLNLVLPKLPSLPADTAIIASTTKGAVDEISARASVNNGQPWQLADEIGDILKITGWRATVSAACASGTLALINAAQMIGQGEAEAVVVVGIDILSTFVAAGFAGLYALSPASCRPFDQDRDGLSLGEGAAVILLASEQAVKDNNWSVQGRLSAWGAAGDAGHITAPSRDARGLIVALKQIVIDNKIGAINAHGTGTNYNDAMEMVAIRKLWPETIPFHSVKGAIGHCLGAAGVIEAALAVKSLAAGKIPPTVGLIRPDGDIAGISGTKKQDLLFPSVLSCNSGFGGINAAVLFTET